MPQTSPTSPWNSYFLDFNNTVSVQYSLIQMHLRDANTPATETKPSQWSLFQPTDPPTPSTISISTPQSQQHFSNTPIPHLPVELIEDIISYLIIPPKQLFQIATALRIDRLRRKSIPFIPEASIDNASAKGQVELLQWWKESNLSLEYTEKSVLEACRNGHVDVIQWWLDSGLPIKYKDWLGVDGVMVAAAEGGHVDVMKVWSGSGLEFNVSDIEIDVASANGHVDVLEWCTGESKHEFRWSTQALDMASANGYVNVLDWWVASALPLKYTADSMDKASTNGNVRVLEWWVQSGLKMVYTERAMLGAVENGHLEVLKWWKRSGLVIKLGRRWSTDGLYTLNQAGHHKVVVWLMENGYYKDSIY